MKRLGPVQAVISGRSRTHKPKFAHNTVLSGSLDLIGKTAVPTVRLSRSGGDFAGAVTHPLIH